MTFVICLAFQALVVALAQQVGTHIPNHSPAIIIQNCNETDECQDEQLSLVLDANWRWVHEVGGYQNCAHYDPVNCAIEGVSNYSKYGIFTDSENRSVSLRMQRPDGSGGGSRLYVTDNEGYKTFNLINRELAFEVDVSSLECGTNGALYFVSMDATGGQGVNNKAGAPYGLGYCDAQCPANRWNDSFQGFCCTEMDIWEANRQSSALTAHPCMSRGPCSGSECHDGFCDSSGCDVNSYRLGDVNFYGRGMAVDTNRPITIVTQFFTEDGTDSGNITEIRQMYLQDGKVISNPKPTLPGIATLSLSAEYCAAELSDFGQANIFQSKGALSEITSAFREGMVLTLSLWEDKSTEMRWLDSVKPMGGSQPGDKRGRCNASENTVEYIDSHEASAYTKFSKIRYGMIGSTTTARRLAVSFQV